MSCELPPQVQGSSELTALRDYLVRLAQSLEKITDSAASAAANRAVGESQKAALRDIRSQAASLKALIVKNAGEVCAYADAKVEEYDSMYVAKSDFGSYYEQIETKVETTARSTVESYRYADAIEGLRGYMTELNGQIRRGVMEDPQTHELHLGIAVSERLSFTGQTQTSGGVTYYELSPGQTLGLYTSTGWQFWISGVKRGWFSSEDSMLHVSNIVVEDTLQMSANWQITTVNGCGLRYIGG